MKERVGDWKGEGESIGGIDSSQFLLLGVPCLPNEEEMEREKETPGFLFFGPFSLFLYLLFRYYYNDIILG